MVDSPTASSTQRRCVFVTVLWGDWHRNIFLDVNLPTMLSPGNLPALAAGVDCEYLVYTTSKDALQMTRNRVFQQLRSIVPVSLRLFLPSRTKNIFSLQHEIWQAATERARRHGAFILLMPPDVAWADGSFACLRAALEAGKRALFMTYPRVVSETIGPAMAEHFPLSAGQARTIAAKDMVALAVTHIHPLMAAYDRTAAHFPIHPEMILWPIEGDGFLLRLLARELFCFEPGHYALNAQSLLAQMPPLEEIHVFRNSLEFLGVSFTPLWKDMEWYLARRQLDPLFVGRWWIDYDSPMNDYLSTVNLRFTCGAADEACWRSVESQADALFAHLRSAREFVRVLLTLDRMGHSRVAAFLASALRVHGLARRWPHRGPFLILAPTDEALEHAGFNRVPGDGLTAAEVRDVIESHVAALPAAGAIEDSQVVKTLAGRTLQLSDTRRAERSGANIVLPIDEVYNLSGKPAASVGLPQLHEVRPAAKPFGDRRLHAENELQDSTSMGPDARGAD
jgi:hypothetical protein